MINTPLASLDDYKDIMVKNNARIARSLGLSKETVLRLAQKASRDNARTCMQWSGAPNAGFTNGKPWFVVNSNYKDINVESQLDDPGSILNFYRDALQFRRDNPLSYTATMLSTCPRAGSLRLRAQPCRQEAARHLLIFRKMRAL